MLYSPALAYEISFTCEYMSLYTFSAFLGQTDQVAELRRQMELKEVAHEGMLSLDII